MMKSRLLWSILVVQLGLASLSHANEVIGCGGFIKSNTEINYKIIKVKLLTKDGAVKYTTEASPVNGYYMIPIYNKGDYVLQVNPPLGWSFEPSQISINIDGKTDPCSKNEDINFFFKGFGLSGKIVTKGDASNQGPSGVKLFLTQNGKQIGTAESGADGSYYFSNVMPGTYQVEAVDKNLKFAQNKATVDLSKDNWYAKENIVVSGYTIEGFVTSSDKSPIADAVLELHFTDQSNSKIDTKGFECTPARDGLKICETKSDQSGRFSFSNIAFGKYKLKANLKHDSLKFGVRPEIIDVDLTRHKNLILTDSFQLDHVVVDSVAVLSEKNKPLENGEVFLNGNKITNTGKDGKFSLGKLTSGSYKIEIKSKHVHFEPKTVRVDLSSWSTIKSDATGILGLSRFQAKSFDVCGRVKINNQNLASKLAQSVQIKVYSSDSLIKSTKLRDDLTYCLELDSGREYVVKADLTDSLSQLLRLVPLEKRISVFDSALFDVDFEQLEARLDGQIRLLAGKSISAPQDLKVVLKSVEAKSDWSKEIQVKCVQVKEGPIECSFTQSNLLFGKYELTTNYDDLYCWKPRQQADSITINIDSESQMVRIEQTGFKLNVKLSHGGVNLKLVEPAKKDTVIFSRNVLSDSTDLVSSMCLPQVAQYRLLIDSCHKFTKNEPDYVDIAADIIVRGANTVDLTAFRHKLTVAVFFKLTDPTDAGFLKENDLIVEATSDSQNEIIQFRLESSTSDELKFTGSGWFEANKQVRLVAKSDKVLFEANNLVRKIDERNCASNQVRFDAKLGIFIVGSINSVSAGVGPVEGVEVTVKSGETVIDKLTAGSVNGFKLGPYKAPISQYSVELSKSGFLFAKSSDQPIAKTKNLYELKYQAEKLGRLTVKVQDGKQKTALESVLMSLSSENRLFRQTIKTDSQGQVVFESLKPGLYYLIVMMQEYEFKPNSHPIEIKDGVEASLTVEATRIAYSCFGRVTSINGRSESDGSVLVEAQGVRSELDVNLENDLCKSSRENAELDPDGLGTYRIRNLKPNCVYEVNVKRLRDDGSGLKIAPLNYVFRVNHSDVLDRNFIVLTRNEQVDVSLWATLSGGVDEKPVNQYVRVKLFKTTQPDTILATQYALVNSIAYLGPVVRDPSQQYAVSVELLAPPTTTSTSNFAQQQQHQLQQLPVVDKTELGFYPDSKHKHLQVRFDSDKRRAGGYLDYKQQYQTFYFTVPLFVIALSMFFNSKKTIEVLSKLFQTIQQRLGLVTDGLRNKKPDPSQQTSVQSKPGKSTREKSSRGRDTASDSERNKPKAKPPVAEAVPKQAESNNEESDYEADYTSEEGETLTIVKLKPKKI